MSSTPFRITLLAAAFLFRGLAAGETFVLKEACRVRDLSSWKVNSDGGDGISFSLREEKPSRAPCLILEYEKGPKGWGNVVTQTELSPDTVGLVLRFRVLSAREKAGFYVWLFEKDGDAWFEKVRPRGKELREAAGGVYDEFLSLTRFSFRPRGDGKRAITTVDRLILGVSGGSAKLVIESVSYLLREKVEKRSAAPPTSAAGGSIAILEDASLPRRGAPADPRRLRAVLTRAGFSVTPLSAADLSATDLSSFDLLIIPTGPVFPAEARENLISYLKKGKALLTVGGYAFDEPVVPIGGGKFARCLRLKRAEELTGEIKNTSINTRFGETGDTLRLSPDQVGIFDPSDRFSDAAGITGPGVVLTGSFRGWSATALIGSNHPVFPQVYARWDPLLFAEDRYGRRIAPAAGILQHFGGPFRGGRWAFFGVDSTDLFAPGMLPEEFLVRLVNKLVAGCFSWNLLTRHRCMRPGEKTEVEIRVGNFGRLKRKVKLSFFGGTAAPVTKSFVLFPGETKRETISFPAPAQPGFYPLRSTLEIEDGGDSLPARETFGGFCVWDPASGVEGPEITFSENLFRIGGRPVFLTGTNQTGVVWFSPREEPFLWVKDFTRQTDHGLNVIRFLHFSPFAKGRPRGWKSASPLDLAGRPDEELIRKTDALVFLAARSGQIPLLTLHDWQPVALGKEELEAQKKWVRFWARRYARVPGLLFDIQNEPTVALKSDPRHRELWGEFAKTLPAPLAGAFSDPEEVLAARPEAWNDPRGVLRERFRVWLLRRWTAAHLSALREVDPGRLLTLGFLPTNGPCDKALGAKGLSFSSFHFYGRLSDFALEAKWADRRLAGAGLSVTEFGAQEAHNLRTAGRTGEAAAESVRRYFYTVLVTFGLGGSMALSWDMRDLRETVFPWGMAYPDGRPKTVLRAFRAASLLLRTFRPKPVEPRVVVLLPDSNRLSAGKAALDRAVSGTIRTFLHLNVPFALATEEDVLEGNIGRRAPSARLWPLPHVGSEEALKRIYRELNETAARMFGALTDTINLRVETEGGEVFVAANPGRKVTEARFPGPLTLPLPAETASLAAFGPAGVLRAVVGQGEIRREDRPFLELPAPTVLFSASGEDIERAPVLVLSALAEGEVVLHRAAFPPEFLNFRVGEIRSGRFVTYEEGKIAPPAPGGPLRFPLDGLRAGCLILIGNSRRFEEAAGRLVDLTRFKNRN